jgi:hypothetical protein
MGIETEVTRLGVQRYVSCFCATPVEQLQSPSTDALSLEGRVHRLKENHRDPSIISLPEQKERQPVTPRVTNRLKGQQTAAVLLCKGNQCPLVHIGKEHAHKLQKVTEFSLVSYCVKGNVLPFTEQWSSMLRRQV